MQERRHIMPKAIILVMMLGFVLWCALAVYIAGAIPKAANNYATYIIERVKHDS